MLHVSVGLCSRITQLVPRFCFLFYLHIYPEEQKPLWLKCFPYKQARNSGVYACAIYYS